MVTTGNLPAKKSFRTKVIIIIMVIMRTTEPFFKRFSKNIKTVDSFTFPTQRKGFNAMQWGKIGALAVSFSSLEFIIAKPQTQV